MNSLIELIKRSNGDILGIIYFILIIIYILNRNQIFFIEYIILIGAIIGLLVDLVISIKTINEMLKKNEYNNRFI